MTMYYINDIPISRWGATMFEFTGWENMPKRKGTVSHSYADSNGVVPFLRAGEVFFEARELKLVLNIIADNVQQAQINILNLFAELRKPQKIVLKIDYLDRSFNTFIHKKVESDRLTNVAGKVAYETTIYLTEYDPTEPIRYVFASDYLGNIFEDYKQNKFTINE